METSKMRRLWGHEFRVVANGLAEEDVALFVEWLMRKYQASLEKSSHVEPLHQLAKMATQEAERMAIEIEEKADKESERRSAEIISEAEHAGHEIIERASRAATALEADARRTVQEKLLELDETLLTMKKWADEEFGKLKEREEGTRLFHSTFESYLRLLEGGFEPDESGEAESWKAGASEDQAEQLNDSGGNARNESSRFSKRAYTGHNGDASGAFDDSEARGGLPHEHPQD